MELKHIACDVCGSMRPSVVGFPPIEDRLARKFPSLSGVAVVRCRNCGFYFLDPLPVFTAHELSFIYDSAY